MKPDGGVLYLMTGGQAVGSATDYYSVSIVRGPETPPNTDRKPFATGERHNDIEQQMRNIARNMTSAEMDMSGRWYSSHQ